MFKIFSKVGLILIFLSLNFQLIGQSFSKVTKTTGLPVVGNSHIAFADYNNDGFSDILISGIDAGTNIVCKLYRNNGDTTFSNSGLVLPQIYQGAISFFDYNNDNYPDIIVSGINNINQKITEIYKNNQNSTFTKIISGLDSVYYSSIATADFDNDGDEDILISGMNNSNQRISKIYRNDKNDYFTAITTQIQAFSNGDVEVCDLNRDGLLDIIVVGLNKLSQKIGCIYINQGNLEFSLIDNILPKLSYSSVTTGDYNQDGFVDIAVSGMEGNTTFVSKIYENLSNLTFSDINASLTGLYMGSLDFFDFDNDGDLDIANSGFDASSRQTIFYKNNGGNNFQVASTIVSDIAQGEVKFIDFDNDWDLDVLISGYDATGEKTILYRNTSSEINNLPSPTLFSDYTNDEFSVVLSWNKASDIETGSNGLYYKINVATSKSNSDIISASADISSGFRNINKINVQTDTFLILNDLQEGKYYWQVQTIDNNFLGSQFSTIDSFVVCGKLNIGLDTLVCPNSNLHLSTGQGDDVVNWYSLNNGNIGTNTFDLNYLVSREETIWAELTNSFGCILRDTILVNLRDLPQLNLNSDTSICKNDFLTLTANNSLDSVNWYSNSSLILENSFNYEKSFDVSESVVCEGFDGFGCVNYDTVFVNLFDLPNYNLGADTAVCSGSYIQLSVNSLDSVNWFYEGALLLANSESINIEIDQQKEISAEFFDVNRCKSFDTIIVSPRQLPIANAGKDTTICFNSVIVLGANLTATNGTQPYSYNWTSTYSVNDDHISNPSSYPDASTKYILTVLDNFNCSDMDTINVTVNPPTTISLASITKMCQGQGVILGGNPTASGSLFPYVYSWTPSESLTNSSSPNPIAYPTDTLNYQLVVSSYFCPSDTAYTTVNFVPVPNVYAGEDVYVGEGETVTLSASGAETYVWSPNLFILGNNYAQTIDVKPERTTVYSVTGTNEWGCSAKDTVVVSIKYDIFIPNLFSPNNDGKNDYFKVYGYGIKEISLNIYDKNGLIVFSSQEKDEIMNVGWDGTLNGKRLKNGAYIWIISGTFIDDSIINYNQNKGTVFLVN